MWKWLLWSVYANFNLWRRSEFSFSIFLKFSTAVPERDGFATEFASKNNKNQFWQELKTIRLPTSLSLQIQNFLFIQALPAPPIRRFASRPPFLQLLLPSRSPIHHRRWKNFSPVIFSSFVWWKKVFLSLFELEKYDVRYFLCGEEETVGRRAKEATTKQSSRFIPLLSYFYCYVPRSAKLEKFLYLQRFLDAHEGAAYVELRNITPTIVFGGEEKFQRCLSGI